MFPDAAGDPFEIGGNYTATQNMAELVHGERAGLDDGALGRRRGTASRRVATTGAFTFFNQQYDSLAAHELHRRARSYNAMQLTLRKRWSHGYQFDVNYTLAHAKDHGSAVERGSFFGNYRQRRATRAS